MNIIFISISQAVGDINNRGIYPDLLRKFNKEGHKIFIVSPLERRYRKKTKLSKSDNLVMLNIKTLNLTKSKWLEKLTGTLLIDIQFLRGIKKYLSHYFFDIILYSTPPITFLKTIKYLKDKNNANTYLLLKDIFPQNAVDIGLFKKNGFIYKYFSKKEKQLYEVSDFIGCMSKANVNYLINHNKYLSSEKVEVCPNSIEISNIKKVDKLKILEEYKIPENSIKFLYGGNLGKPQGIDFLICVLKYYFKRNDIIFIIVGSGTEYKKIEEWKEINKPSNVLLLNFIKREKFDELIQVGDIGLIFLDRRFTIPNFPSRLLSYLENKMPVLLATDKNTDIGYIAEQNGFGLWSECGDLNAFNKNVEYFVNNPEMIKVMGEKGYKYLLDNYTVDKSYDIIMKHFKNDLQ